MIAEWGDTRHADMTFSMSKSYIGMLAGIAVADGLIADLDAPVGKDVVQNRGVIIGERVSVRLAPRCGDLPPTVGGGFFASRLLCGYPPV